MDIIDGKVVLDKEEKKIMVNAYRERIANCREMYKRMVLGIDKKKKLDFK